MRERWIDALKGFSIIFIIFRHLDPSYIVQDPILSRSINCVFCAFSVQIFFTISGMFFDENKHRGMSLGDEVLAKIKSWGLPYLKLCLINFIFLVSYNFIAALTTKPVNFFWWILYNGPRSFWGVLYGHSYYLPNCAPLWYLPCAIVAYLLFAALMKLKKEWQRLVLCIVYVVIYGLEQANVVTIVRALQKINPLFNFAFTSTSFGPGIVTDHFQLPWHAETALLGATFMYLGYLIRQYAKFRGNLLIDAIMVASLWIGFYLDFHYFWATDMDRFYTNPDLVAFYILTLTTMCPVIYFFRRFNVRLKVLELFGRNTLLVLAFNLFAFEIVQKVWEMSPLGADVYTRWWFEGVGTTVVMGAGLFVYEVVKKKIRPEE